MGSAGSSSMSSSPLLTVKFLRKSSIASLSADAVSSDRTFDSLIASKIPDVRRFEAGKVLGAPDGSAAPYYFMATIWFDDVESLQSAMGSPEGQAAGADIPNFAPAGATMMIAEA